MRRVSYFGRCVPSMLDLVLFARGARTEEVNCKRRVLPIALRDKLNLPIQRISTADFEAKVHGKPIKILSLAPDPRPHRLVLILDTSGSMGSTAGESPLITLEFALARHFFDVNRPRSQMALLMFNNHVTNVVDFASGNSAVCDKLPQIASDPKFVKTNFSSAPALPQTIFQRLPFS